MEHISHASFRLREKCDVLHATESRSWPHLLVLHCSQINYVPLIFVMCQVEQPTSAFQSREKFDVVYISPQNNPYGGTSVERN
jgi:hypothetical protein